MTRRLGSLACMFLVFAILTTIDRRTVTARDADGTTRVLIVVGASEHPPGTHEVAAGGRLMKFALENASNIDSIRADLVMGWPDDTELKSAADSVVFIGDLFPPVRMPDSESVMTELGEMMERGCSIVCIHYATGLGQAHVGPGGEHPLLEWMGGYFATGCEHHQSIARIFPQAEIVPAADGHPVSHGWKPFTINDEPYIENYFGPADAPSRSRLIEFATSMLPPEQPKRQVVAWGVDRPDGGRGFAVVMPHYYRSWGNDDLRTLILNGIVWSAGRDIPADGVSVTLSDLTQFAPDSAAKR